MSGRRHLYTIGMRGSSAAVFAERLASGQQVVRVQWREGGRRLTKTWPYSAEHKRIAKLTAEGIVDRLERMGVSAVQRFTIGELFDKYVLAKESGWRRASRVNEINRWRVFTLIVPATTFADLVTEDTLDEFRATVKGRYAPNQIVQVIAQVKRVWKLAAARRWLPFNILAGYENRLAKDEAPKDIPEYTPAEVAKLENAFDFRKPREWRIWVALHLAALLGPRERSLFALEWRDVDLTARTVRWRPEVDKRAKERYQPLPLEAVFAFRVAMVWRRRIGYTGAYVFPTAERPGVKRGSRVGRTGDRAYSYSAAVEQLHRGCRLVGVPVIKHRAFHGLRRHAAGQVLAATGSIKAAGDWIGDTDVRTLTRSYLKKRPEEQRELARALRMPTEKKEASATEVQPDAEAVDTTTSNT